MTAGSIVTDSIVAATAGMLSIIEDKSTSGLDIRDEARSFWETVELFLDVK